MKKLVLAALLCLPILAGCTAAAAPSPSLPARLAPTKETENDILRCYPLDGPECRFFAFGEDLWLITQEEVVKFTGKQLIRTGRWRFPGQACRVSISENGIICLNPAGECVVVLSPNMEEISACSVPEGVQGTPHLSTDGKFLYFCTSTRLMRLECATGICATLREGIQAGSEVTDILGEEGLILCTTPEGTAYLSAEDGTWQNASPPVTAWGRVGSRLCLNVRCGENDCLYLGANMLPLPPGMRFLAIVPESNAALVFRSANANLILYDLTTGNQLSQIHLGSDVLPVQAWSASDGRIFVLQQGFLYQWMPEIRPAQDLAVSITPLYTEANPNRKGLEQCRLRAGFLEQQYGFQIALTGETVPVLPAGVQAESEHITPFLRNALDQVEQGLLRLPSELIRSAVQSSSQTTLCILRSIKVDGDSVRSYAFWNGKKRIVLLAAGEGLAEAVLRGLYPLIDMEIMSRSAALDQWEQRNSEGFRYGSMAQSGCADAQGSISAMDDRASLLLAAVTPNNRELFCDAILQKKLRYLAAGLREAFPSLKEKGTLPWEQYLW